MLSRKTYDLRLMAYNFRGFTLLELLVVLAIMALFTAMSAPAISGYLRGARLRGGAREIASALRHARQLAITKRTVYSVDFNINAQEFWVEYNGGVNDGSPGLRGTGSTLVGEVRTLPDTIDFDPGSHPPPPPYNFTARGTGPPGITHIHIVDPRGSGREIIITGATGHIKIEH